MSEFRAAYSKLIRAVWVDPGLTAKIESNPALLSDFGFTDTPSSVTFTEASGTPSVVGYDDQMTEASGSSVTFYIPPKPNVGGASGGKLEDVTVCCCCCPCCTCT